MRPFLIATIASAVAAASSPACAQAEAGSTGGTIGKQGRSAAGETDTIDPRGPAPSKNSGTQGVAKPRQGAGSACARLVGVWLGPTSTDIIFKADRTATSPAFSDAGPWTCNNGRVVISWKQWGTDQCTLSPEGIQMTCTNSLIGNSFSRTRKSGG